MDTRRFAHLTRILSDSLTRRGVLATVASVAGFQLSEGVAKRRQRGRKKRGGTRGRLRAQAKPGREVTDLTADFTIDTCGFPVQIHQEGKVIALDFGDRLLFAVPGAEWTLTNPESGASRRVVIPGPEFVEFNEDGSVTVSGSGPWAWGRRHPVTRDPGIWLTIGRFVWIFDAEGNLLSAEFVGRSENLCDSLA